MTLYNQAEISFSAILMINGNTEMHTDNLF